MNTNAHEIIRRWPDLAGPVDGYPPAGLERVVEELADGEYLVWVTDPKPSGLDRTAGAS